MNYSPTNKKEKFMINMASMNQGLLAFTNISVNLTRIIFLNISLKIIHLIMMMTISFLEVFSIERKIVEAQKDRARVLGVLVLLVQPYLNLIPCLIMMIFLKVLEAEEVILALLNHRRLETLVMTMA